MSRTKKKPYTGSKRFAFVYYVLRDWSQNHENYEEQDVEDVYEIAQKFKNY